MEGAGGGNLGVMGVRSVWEVGEERARDRIPKEVGFWRIRK